jgi:DNA-directed RNA polymerase subunit RPC12/RpoP
MILLNQTNRLTTRKNIMARITLKNVTFTNFTFGTIGGAPTLLKCTACDRTYDNNEYLDLIGKDEQITCLSCSGKTFIVNPEPKND